MHVILLGLLLVTQSQSPARTAGERYKSIRELKDIPASQVIEVMSVIAGSLDVTCAHCHTDEWVSDEKPNKVKAREMIALTRRIDREFGGQGTITCNTCHQGRAVPPTVSLLVNAGWHRPLTPAPEAPLPALDGVLQRYLTAIGGPDSIAKIASRTFSGQVTRMNGRTPPASGRYRATVSLPGSLSVDTAFSYPPEANGELALVVVRPARLREIYPKMSMTGRSRVGEKDAIEVTATTASGAVHRLFFDGISGLLLRRYSEKRTVLGPLPEEFDFEDYRDAGGVMMPHVIHGSRADYGVTFRIESIE